MILTDASTAGSAMLRRGFVEMSAMDVKTLTAAGRTKTTSGLLLKRLVMLPGTWRAMAHTDLELVWWRTGSFLISMMQSTTKRGARHQQR